MSERNNAMFGLIFISRNFMKKQKLLLSYHRKSSERVWELSDSLKELGVWQKDITADLLPTNTISYYYVEYILIYEKDFNLLRLAGNFKELDKVTQKDFDVYKLEEPPPVEYAKKYNLEFKVLIKCTI